MRPLRDYCSLFTIFLIQALEVWLVCQFNALKFCVTWTLCCLDDAVWSSLGVRESCSHSGSLLELQITFCFTKRSGYQLPYFVQSGSEYWSCLPLIYRSFIFLPTSLIFVVGCSHEGGGFATVMIECVPKT